jgi:hypothetical protein
MPRRAECPYEPGRAQEKQPHCLDEAAGSACSSSRTTRPFAVGSASWPPGPSATTGLPAERYSSKRVRRVSRLRVRLPASRDRGRRHRLAREADNSSAAFRHIRSPGVRVPGNLRRDSPAPSSASPKRSRSVESRLTMRTISPRLPSIPRGLVRIAPRATGGHGAADGRDRRSCPAGGCGFRNGVQRGRVDVGRHCSYA